MAANCPICWNPFADQEPPDAKGMLKYRCDCCGQFRITESVLDDLASEREHTPVFHGLAATARQRSDVGGILEITPDNWRGLAAAHVNTPVSRKAQMLLELLRKRSREFGPPVKFTPEFDWPVIDAASPDECLALVESLRSQGLVIDQGITAASARWALSMSGWQAVEPVAGSSSGRCFVAMSFAETDQDIFDLAIKPAVEEDCGFLAVRVDREHFPEHVVERILVDIRRAQFVVADFTQQKCGVYFEAGFALGLGREVIWTCRHDHIDGPDFKLHFDTNHFPHIVWKSLADLREKLATRIRARIPGARLQGKQADVQ